MTHTSQESIMGRALLAAALFVATMSITVSMAATEPAGPSATLTHYQDPN